MFVLTDHPAIAAQGRRPPLAVARLWETPWTTVDLRVFATPGADGTHVLATLRVVFPADAAAVELAYDQGRFAEPVPPLLLVAAAAAGIYRVWGGPPHFIRYALHRLAAAARRLVPN